MTRGRRLSKNKVGLPIVIATAFVQEGIGGGRVPSGAEADGGEATAQPASETRAYQGRRISDRWDVDGAELAHLAQRADGGLLAFAGWGVVAAGWLLLSGPPEPGGTTAAGLSGGEAGRRIAVLPLANERGPMSGD